MYLVEVFDCNFCTAVQNFLVMHCFSPIEVTIVNCYGESERVKVPCGKCEACIHNRTTEWAQRLSDEYQFSVNGVFLTLTYNDENLPPKVNKDDIQKFFKRLRKRCEPMYFTENGCKVRNGRYRPLRYFLTSEYGPEHNRPHYHAEVMDIIPRGIPRPTLAQLYDIINQSWQKGFIYVEPVTIGRIRYVVNYMVKDAHDDLSDDLKKTLFNLKSNGLGKKFIDNEQNRFNLGNRNDFLIPSDSGKRRMPRYYKEKLFDKERRQLISYNQRRLQEHTEHLAEIAAGGSEVYKDKVVQRQIHAENEYRRKRRLRRLGLNVK